MLQIAILWIICTYSAENFSKLWSTGLNHQLSKLSLLTVLYCVGVSDKHFVFTIFSFRSQSISGKKVFRHKSIVLKNRIFENDYPNPLIRVHQLSTPTCHDLLYNVLANVLMVPILLLKIKLLLLPVVHWQHDCEGYSCGPLADMWIMAAKQHHVDRLLFFKYVLVSVFQPSNEAPRMSVLP